jgi:glycosyltransferase involved in cell wall biosynthesis
VKLARARHPGADLAVLSHPGHGDTIRAAGADRVIEIPGRRFGLLRLPPWKLLQLRAEAFTEVVIPQMTHYPELHSNIYRVVAAIAPDRVVVVPGDEPVQEVDGARFRLDLLQHSFAAFLARWDAHVFLATLAAACLVRRPAVAAAGGRRRKVLHIISSLGVGGAQVQLAELLNRTPATEFDIELLVLGESDGDFSRQWLKRDDITISYVRNWPRLALSVGEIADRCRAGGYDLVHTWLFMANMVGAAGARLAGVPVVIGSVRNLSVWKREKWYRQWWHRLGDMLGSRAADVVTVNARALVEDHARWAWMPARDIEVIHNGLDPARVTGNRVESRATLLAASGQPEGTVFVGTVGRLAHEKDQRTFLRVLAGVRAVRRDVHGIVIGDGELRGTLEAEATALGLDGGAVTFLGRRPDARSLAAGFDLFVLTSRSEGFPNVLLEASFLAVPCVATNIAGNPDVLDYDCSLFPAGDVAGGVRRVLQALADPQRTAERTAAVRRRALELFTADRSTANWLTLYRRLLAPQQPRI